MSCLPALVFLKFSTEPAEELSLHLKCFCIFHSLVNLNTIGQLPERCRPQAPRQKTKRFLAAKAVVENVSAMAKKKQIVKLIVKCLVFIKVLLYVVCKKNDT